MIYSVFDWTSGKYNYYEAPGEPEVAPQPLKTSPRAVGQAGVAPEDIAPVLPNDAVPVGSGEEAKGTIAVTAEEAKNGNSFNISWKKAIAIGIGAYILWKYA